MSLPPPEDPPREPPRTVLETLADRTGLAPKVLLPDEDSEHGASPIVTKGLGQGADSGLRPEGRGNYQILGEIARGGMGLVLKGHDTDLGRDVALKVLDAKLAANPTVVQRFIEEAQIGGQLQHPGIVPVYELGMMADERPYFTMKLVKGRTLSALLQQRKTPRDARGRMLSIFESVCQTMAYAHSKGVLHRDLKPANIMVGAFGEVQVVDWGLAKVLNRGGVEDERRARHSMMTVIETVRSGPGSTGSDSLVGSVMGTPAYMAPEQAQGEIEKLDERADVFSLGAILCEILTGRPPYEEVEGENTVVQAARAKLDPARERIRECGADEGLQQLCLDCLMPARDARPRNAEEVARIVREYRAGVEERAHEAELAALAAGVKATEERRARKLTLALAATVVTALVLGGGGFSLLQQQRRQRIEQTRTAVEDAHGESLELARAGRPEDALDAARRALALAETGEVDAALRERAAQFVVSAERDLQAVEEERELLAQDERLRSRLEDLRLQQIETIGNPPREAELDAAFEQAFLDYGVDLEAADIVPAMERIRERDIAEEVAVALDDWGRLRRRVRGARSPEAQNLSYLALDLDLDPDRRRLREAILGNDLDTLLELARPENLHKLPPGSVWILSATLWDSFPAERPVVYRIFDQALGLYPDDFLLQFVGGMTYGQIDRYETALACWNSARALRPNNSEVLWRQAEALFFSGHMIEAMGVYRGSIELQPDNAGAHYGLGMTYFQLGDYAAARDSLARSLELHEDFSRRADLMVARYFLGEASSDELVRAMDSSYDPLIIATYGLALIDHPDPARRNRERGLAALEEMLSSYPGDPRFTIVEAMTRIERGDFAGAHETLKGRYHTPSFLVLSPGGFDFLRSVVYSGLGQPEVARECHARGLATWRELTASQPEAWSRSDVMRWRRRSEQALGM